MTEVFKDIEFDPNYQISNYGRVLRKTHQANGPKGNLRSWTEKFMTVRIISTGYPFVMLKGRGISIHRLVAMAFIPNPENKKEVNHKNGIRTDFRIENLEWVTRTENQIHSWRQLNRKATWQGKPGFQHHASRSVNVYDVDGNLITGYGSTSHASKLNGYHHYAVEWAIKKKAGYYRGQIWAYAN